MIDSEIKLILDEINNELKKLTRRVDSVQHSVDLNMKDRDILEDLLGRMTSVEAVLEANRKHQDLKTQDIKADIQDVHDKVEQTASETQETVEENLGALATQVSERKVILIKKEGFWDKFLNKFKKVKKE
mgnify:CR=1 FL=1